MRLYIRAGFAAALLLGLVAVVAGGVGRFAAAEEPSNGPTTLALPVVMTANVNEDWALVNGSFEDGWTDILPPPDAPYGYLINQQPNGWQLSWVDIGSALYDSNDIATGVGELIHKLAGQLPPHEQPGGSAALILDGETVYKMFHRAGRFGAQLTQRIESMPAGVYRLTVPVQLHWQEKLDPDGDWDQYTAESGAWVLVDGTQSGGWAHAKQMGDRTWFYHVVEFNVPQGAAIDILIRVKSRWVSPKDFFVDDIRLEEINLETGEPFERNGVVWQQRPLWAVPAAERVTVDWTR